MNIFLQWLSQIGRSKVPPLPAKDAILAAGDNYAKTVPFDEHLLERARIAWHLGDWDSLIQIPSDVLDHHPDRAKLALLVASALSHTDRHDAAAIYLRRALEAGCEKRLAAQVMIADVHNSLGNASAVLDRREAAQEHYRLAVTAGTPAFNTTHLAAARAMHEHDRMQREPDQPECTEVENSVSPSRIRSK